MSKLIGQTRKEVPVGLSARSHELLLRAGYIHQVAAGIFSYLPLGLRVLQKICAILRQELQAIGGQEVQMPVVQPADLWQQSGRWYKIGAEMGRFIDRKGHNMALAMTHEEATADMVRQFVHSYRDLPRLVYHVQTKWRDDPRPRAGLIRVREFTMKDSYSLDHSWQGLEQQYYKHYHAYFRIFGRCALPVMAVLSDTGMMGGRMAHEFMYASEVGEDIIIHCRDCGYKANRQVAKFRKGQSTNQQQTAPLSLQPLQEVATPNCKTIAEVSQLLQVEASQCAKMVFFVASFAQEQSAVQQTQSGDIASGSLRHQQVKQMLVAAVLPGNMDLNQTKLGVLIAAKELRPADSEEILAVGAVPGYASPIGLIGGSGAENQRCLPLIIVVDDLIASDSQVNWIGGANKEGFHLRGLNYGRDFKAHYVGDLSTAAAGCLCHDCGSVLHSYRAVEVGNIFQLGTFYSEAMGCYFKDESGNQQPVIMGSYGIGVGRLAACIAEQHNDTDGLCWPISVAPYQLHLLSLAGKNDTEVQTLAEELYQQLIAAGVEVLFDEREQRPGFKFKDADLIGIPICLTVSKRSLEHGAAEFQLRSDKPSKEEPKTFWPMTEVIAKALAEIERLERQCLAFDSSLQPTDTYSI